MKRKISVVSGDGIGPEVTKEALKVFEKVRPLLKNEFEFFFQDLGAESYLRTREVFPKSVYQEMSDSDAVFLGAVGDPRVAPGILEKGILLKLRFDFDLYINLRPCILYDGVFCPIKNKTTQDIHFTVIRENTESVYTGMGGIFKEGTKDEVAIQEDINTRKGVERCIRFAYEYSQNHARKKELALVDKANVLTFAHGLWRRVFKEVGKEYPNIAQKALFVDAAAMDFIRKPETLDVLVTNNIFGDILTDLGAILSGGLGTAASANLHPERSEGARCNAMFEPIHGSAPDIAGQGKANPIAAILAMKMLLDFFEETNASKKIEQAVSETLRNEKLFQPNSSETLLSTSAIGDLIASRTCM